MNENTNQNLNQETNNVNNENINVNENQKQERTFSQSQVDSMMAEQRRKMQSRLDDEVNLKTKATVDKLNEKLANLEKIHLRDVQQNIINEKTIAIQNYLNEKGLHGIVNDSLIKNCLKITLEKDDNNSLDPKISTNATELADALYNLINRAQKIAIAEEEKRKNSIFGTPKVNNIDEQNGDDVDSRMIRRSKKTPQQAVRDRKQQENNQLLNKI